MDSGGLENEDEGFGMLYERGKRDAIDNRLAGEEAIETAKSIVVIIEIRDTGKDDAAELDDIANPEKSKTGTSLLYAQ